MLNRKTFQTIFAAAAFATLVFVGTDAAAETNNNTDQVVMQQLAELINTYGTDQEDPNTLTLDAIDKAFDTMNGNLNAGDDDDDC